MSKCLVCFPKLEFSILFQFHWACSVTVLNLIAVRFVPLLVLQWICGSKCLRDDIIDTDQLCFSGIPCIYLLLGRHQTGNSAIERQCSILTYNAFKGVCIVSTQHSNFVLSRLQENHDLDRLSSVAFIRFCSMSCYKHNTRLSVLPSTRTGKDTLQHHNKDMEYLHHPLVIKFPWWRIKFLQALQENPWPLTWLD